MATRKPAENLRQEYEGVELTRESADSDPFVQFEKWYREAEAVEEQEANAMSLSTVSAAGAPSSRIVLLKKFDVSGFTFFTNYGSRKSEDVAVNSKASLLFWWPRLARQVRIGGAIERTSRISSEEYFASRPKGSQLGAWASAQSSVVNSRQDLSASYREMEKRFENRDVPCPPHWGGFTVVPDAVEFWQGQENRLHDRLSYSSNSRGSWDIIRLAP